MINIKNLLAGSLAFAALAIGGNAAATTYESTFQGVTFTFDATNGASVFTFTIAGAPDATGDWADATHLQAIGFKDLGVDFSTATATLTSVPAGSTAWTGINSELNANACSGGTPDGAICFSGVPPLALADLMTFTITINGGTLNIADTGPHLKLQFLDANGDKQGSLYSENIPSSTTTTSTTSTGNTTTSTTSGGSVPEPGTLGLLGLGLLGLGYGRRALKTK